MQRISTGIILKALVLTVLFIGLFFGIFWLWKLRVWHWTAGVSLGGILTSVICVILIRVNDYFVFLHQKVGHISSTVTNMSATVVDLSRVVVDLSRIWVDISRNISHKESEIIGSIETLQDTVSQINCDSKEINLNLYKLTLFLEEIEKHLDLKE